MAGIWPFAPSSRGLVRPVLHDVRVRVAEIVAQTAALDDATCPLCGAPVQAHDTGVHEPDGHLWGIPQSAEESGAAPGSGGSSCASFVRELMPSLTKTLRRWYSTVCVLMKSRVPISAFERPSRARRAICAS
jgi:hypothetical protein